MYATYGDTADIGRVVQRGDKHLCWAFDLRGSGDLLEDGIQQGGDIFGRLLVVFAHPALLGRAIDGLEVKLLFAGVEAKHQVEDHILYLFGAAVGLVDLVDDYDGLQSHLDGLLQDEARLRHRAFEGIDEKQAAVSEVEHALYFATEVGVAWGVDDVDLDVLIADADILGEDGDPTLTLEVIVIEVRIYFGSLIISEELTG